MPEPGSLFYGLLPIGSDAPAGAGGGFESIATITVGAGGASSIEFTSIPGTYQHLQVRFIGHRDAAVSSANPLLRFNSDAGSNYSYHGLYGTGTAAAVEASASTTRITVGQISGDTYPNIFGASVVDILDYSSTSKNTTVRSFGGHDRNGSGNIFLQSGAWLNTSAVTSILLFLNAGDWGEFSTAALYGVKA